MSNLFTKKPENKKISLTIGDAYVKPLPMKLLPIATKLADQDKDPTHNFALIIKEVLVDENGKSFEDLTSMQPAELSNAFSIEDFTTIIQAVMPAPEGEAGLGKPN